MEVSNKLYVRNVKEILAEPTRRFPHTSVGSTCSCHLQQGRTNLEYSIVLRKADPSGGKKRLQGYARLSGLWVIASAGSITKRVSLYSISLTVIISSLTTILCKHLCYFQACGKQSEPFSIFHILVLTTVLDCR